MSYFTKGPWEIEYDEEYGNHTVRMGTALESRGNFEPQHEIGYEHGCWFDEDEGEEYPGNRQAREAKANALLIASAPDMFEALQKTLTFIINGRENGYIQMPDADSGDSALETPNIIRKALAKAQGLGDKA